MRIKEWRIRNNLTQKQLSELLEVNQTAISQWEVGHTMPQAMKLPHLANVLNCKIEELYEEEELEIGKKN
ncbi:MAG: helix-turn-helix domain-containing protein [Eubacteriaceae bacterium]